VDRGVVVLAATSDAVLYPNPRHLAASAGRLAAAQRRLAATRRRPVSRRRVKARAEVTRLHAKVARQRHDSAHKLSRRLVDRYDTIALEALQVANMVRSASGTIERPGTQVAQKAGLNRSILDAGWAQLANMIAYKAEEAGRRIILVNPANTSRTCSACGHLHGDDRVTQALWQCCACGHRDHADINIANRAGLARHDTPPGTTKPRTAT
jgi:putative transposase